MIDMREDIKEYVVSAERFRDFVDAHRTTELASLAKKNLYKRAAVKPKLLPLTEDVIKVKNFVDETL